jgi:hypothetical protein
MSAEELCKLKRKLEALQVVAPAMSAGQLKVMNQPPLLMHLHLDPIMFEKH